MKFGLFLFGLTVFVVLQSLILWMLGMGMGKVIVLDITTIVVAQIMYLVVIAALLRAEMARRAAASPETKETAVSSSIEHCDSPN